MTQPLDVTVLMDAAAVPEDDPELAGKPSQGLTEGQVSRALRELGHRVRVVGVADDVGSIMKAFEEHRPGLVFNLTEQFADSRQFDTNVAGLMEMMKIPFTGTGSTGLMLCRDKGLCKEMLAFRRVRVPGFVTLAPGKGLRVPGKLRFPMIVKPTLEDGSDGISMSSVVNNAEELEARARFVHEHWKQVAIAEEYVEGREVYIGIVGNERLKVLPPRGVDFGELGKEHPLVATAKVKHDADYREKWKIRYGAAELSKEESGRVGRVSRRIYRLLRMKDYGRIDLRITAGGEIVFLEANPNPDIGRNEEVAEAAEAAGIKYTALIDRIVRLAMKRYET